MSHNVKITGVSISRMDILASALRELNAEFGTDLELQIGNVASRVWGPVRVIPNTVAVITSKKLRYDITLTEDVQTKAVGMETEALQIEPLRKAFNVPETIRDITADKDVVTTGLGYGRGEDIGMQIALGPIIQRYAVITAEEQAQARGYLTSRQVNKQTGEINVVANVM